MGKISKGEPWTDPPPVYMQRQSGLLHSVSCKHPEKQWKILCQTEIKCSRLSGAGRETNQVWFPSWMFGVELWSFVSTTGVNVNVSASVTRDRDLQYLLNVSSGFWGGFCLEQITSDPEKKKKNQGTNKEWFSSCSWQSGEILWKTFQASCGESHCF